MKELHRSYTLKELDLIHDMAPGTAELTFEAMRGGELKDADWKHKRGVVVVSGRGHATLAFQWTTDLAWRMHRHIVNDVLKRGKAEGRDVLKEALGVSFDELSRRSRERLESEGEA